MKKILSILTIATTVITAQAQTGISYGATFGIGENNATYVGGMTDASALFHQDDHDKGSFGFVARYFLNNHWSIQSGLGFSSLGFDYALAKDYSLLNKDEHFTQNGLSITVLQVPFTAIYAFNPNCRNNRWFVGAGFATMTNTSDANQTSHVLPEGDASGNVSYLDQTMTSSNFTVLTGQLMGGVEKIFRRGSILQFGLTANFGFSNIATSQVSYTIDNKLYEHTFNNQGDYWGFILTYYFKPLGGN